MADKFTKVDVPLAPEASWKDAQVEREHQPEKVKSMMTYRSIEEQVENIDNSIASLTSQKAVLEAEMVKVKTAAEA